MRRPDGRWIATTGGDGTVRIWEADTGELRFTIDRPHRPGQPARLESRRHPPGDGERRRHGPDLEITDGGIRELVSFAAQDTDGVLGAWRSRPTAAADDRRLCGLGGVKIWDASATGGAEWANVAGPIAPGAQSAVDFTPDGRGLSS